MRKIKFRAWSKHTKEMVKLVDIDDFGVTFYSQTAPSFIIPMQFTGLKDKNGKEIYEGDVIEGRDGGLYVRRGNVIFDQGRFVVKIKGVLRNLKSLAPQYKIIGNIYENAELRK